MDTDVSMKALKCYYNLTTAKERKSNTDAKNSYSQDAACARRHQELEAQGVEEPIGDVFSGIKYLVNYALEFVNGCIAYC